MTGFHNRKDLTYNCTSVPGSQGGDDFRHELRRAYPSISEQGPRTPMFAGVREVRGLQVLAAGAPPRFLTNLGNPAEDAQKMAGVAPAILVFGTRAKSPTNRGGFKLPVSASSRRSRPRGRM